MNRHTKRLAVVAGVLFVIALIAVVIFIRVITQQSQQLSDQITAIETDRAQQEIFSRLERTHNETQATRDTLSEYYLQSQSDSIDFLNFIEAQAAQSGVELETGTPTELVRDNVTYLSVGYNLQGSLSRVENFIAQLEKIPYVSQLTSLKLNQESGTVWQATVVIEVQVLTHETN